MLFFNDTATTEIYTLSLHDALPISLKFSFRIRLVDDGLYGAPEPNGSWTGMVGELINRVRTQTLPHTHTHSHTHTYIHTHTHIKSHTDIDRHTDIKIHTHKHIPLQRGEGFCCPDPFSYLCHNPGQAPQPLP